MRKIIPAMILGGILGACSSIDCPLNNTVSMSLGIAGVVDTLKDTLTVSAVRSIGGDTVLLNRSTNTTRFQLPLSHSQESDILELEMTDSITKIASYDTLTITKTNDPHFESVDCGPTFFHKITGVSHTRHHIDSIVINNPTVDYDANKTNLLIYFRPRN